MDKMLSFLKNYKYKIAYGLCLVIAVYVATHTLPVSPSTEAGFMLYMAKFLIAVLFVGVAIYFYAKDSARKRK